MQRVLNHQADPDTGVAQDYSASEVLRATALPKAQDNRDLVRILDQGRLGACTANAALQCVRASHLVQGASMDVEFGSRLFAYLFARATHGEVQSDGGTYLRAIFEVLNKFGFPPESVWPYDDNPDPKKGRFTKMPGMTAMRAAYDQSKPTEYRKVYETGDARLNVIRRALANRQLVCFGTQVSNDFCDGKVQPGEPVLPTSPGESAGGHAMAICGYDAQGNFDIANSWGTDFGDNGFFTASPEFLTSPDANDFWVVRSAPRF